jgi:hypothetical protein
LHNLRVLGLMLDKVVVTIVVHASDAVEIDFKAPDRT